MAWSPASTSRPARASASGRDRRPRSPAASSSRRSTIRTVGGTPDGAVAAARSADTGPTGRGPTVSTAGRRRPQDARRTGQLGEPDRDVAGLEPGRPIALVGGVVLLVHDDDTERRRAATGRRAASRRRHPRRPPGSGATRRPARHRPGPSGPARPGRRGRRGSDRPAATPSRSRGRAAAPVGRAPGWRVIASM